MSALLSCLCLSLQEIHECCQRSHPPSGSEDIDSTAMAMDAEWANRHTIIDEVHPEFSTSKKVKDDHQRCQRIGQRFCKNSMVDNFRKRVTQAVQSFCKSAGNEAAQKKAKEEMLEGKWILAFRGKQVLRGEMFPDLASHLKSLKSSFTICILLLCLEDCNSSFRCSFV